MNSATFLDIIKRRYPDKYKLLLKLPTQGRHFYFWDNGYNTSHKIAGYIFELSNDNFCIFPYQYKEPGISKELILTKDEKMNLIFSYKSLTSRELSQLIMNGSLDKESVKYVYVDLISLAALIS